MAGFAMKAICPGRAPLGERVALRATALPLRRTGQAIDTRGTGTGAVQRRRRDMAPRGQYIG